MVVILVNILEKGVVVCVIIDERYNFNKNLVNIKSVRDGFILCVIK